MPTDEPKKPEKEKRKTHPVDNLVEIGGLKSCLRSWKSVESLRDNISMGYYEAVT